MAHFGGVRGQAAFSFPLLKDRDILQSMAELQVPMTEDDLANPTAAFMRSLYEHFIAVLMGVNREDMSTPQMSAMDGMEHPELHEESIAELVFSALIARLMMVCGVKDFSMRDVYRPSHERTRRCLSAIVNFVKFREERIEKIHQVLDESEHIEEEKRRLEAEQEELLNRATSLQSRASNEASAREDLARDVQRLSVEVNALNHRQSQARADNARLKDMAVDAQSRAGDAASRIADARRENDRLRGRLVSSPEKIKFEIGEMERELAATKDAVVAGERKARELKQKIESMERAEGEMQKTMRLVDEVDAEIKREHEVKAAIESARERAVLAEAELRELEARDTQLQRQIQSANEKLARVQRSQRMKQEEADQAIDIVRKEREVIEQERRAISERAAAAANEIQKVQLAIVDLQRAHLDEMDSVRTDYDRLVDQFGLYNQTLVESLGERGMP